MKKRRISLSLLVFYIVMCAVISFLYYGVYRNNQTCTFRNKLLWQTFALKADKIQEYNDSICYRYSYTDFLFSFKPLEVKYWYTEGEIEKYKLYLVDE